MILFGLSDKGIVRQSNEDTFAVFDCEQYAVSVVCDGMGGAVGGQKASNMAKDSFLRELKNSMKSTAPTPLSVKKAISEAVKKANFDVYTFSQKHKKYSGMGCTLNAFVFLKKQGKIIYANIGDSRLYKIDRQQITKLSKDHSFVQYLIDIGEITEEEAKDHPQKNLITRAIGIANTVKADLYVKKISKSAYYLSCSDGLYSMVDENTIKNIVTSEKPIKEKILELINTANNNGGADNITAVILKAEKEDNYDRR